MSWRKWGSWISAGLHECLDECRDQSEAHEYLRVYMNVWMNAVTKVRLMNISRFIWMFTWMPWPKWGSWISVALHECLHECRDQSEAHEYLRVYVNVWMNAMTKVRLMNIWGFTWMFWWMPWPKWGSWISAGLHECLDECHDQSEAHEYQRVYMNVWMNVMTKVRLMNISGFTWMFGWMLWPKWGSWISAGLHECLDEYQDQSEAHEYQRVYRNVTMNAMTKVRLMNMSGFTWMFGWMPWPKWGSWISAGLHECLDECHDQSEAHE